MKRQENRPQFRGLVKRALGFSLGRSGGDASGVVRRLARAFVIRCVLGRTIFSAHKIGSKKAMLTGLTVLFDCPPGLVSLVGDGDGNELVRLVPQGEVDACLLVSRKPLFATGNQSLHPELLLDEVLAQQPQFRVVRRSPAEQIQSSVGKMHLLRVVGWHGEPKIALGQLVALFSPSNPALPSCAAVSIFLWYTEKAGRKYAPQAMALFRSLRVMPVSQQSWPPSDVLASVPPTSSVPT
jgi:hypothetical protein